MASPIPALRYSNFFAYVALNCLGFEGALAALQAGEKADPKRFLLPSSPKDFMSSETLAHRLHAAISEYPSQGAFTASIIASRSAETAKFSRAITQLCDYFDDLMSGQNFPGWASPGSHYYRAIRCQFSPENRWTSMPTSCAIELLDTGVGYLADDFMYFDTPMESNPATFSTIATHEIRNERDWLELISDAGHGYKFSGSPQPEWDDSFVIPDWHELSIDKPIFISIRSYLNLAYRIIPVKDQRTLLAGWHPGSLVSIEKQGTCRTN
ncbi:hypothetical protein [Rhodoluna limnophila]|uniref:hypothetical protein n=1 Tax=Rhodoluna limnophila TaxID=232537 RepID=UPI00110650F1|nr:hypothetical protein [Rhodoluna limnophila]